MRWVRLMANNYKQLSKMRLSMLVVSTAAAGYAAGSRERIDWGGMGWTCLGTMLASCSANALNQVYEKVNDGMMKRTMNRPLPTGRVSRAHALAFAALAGVGGVWLLAEKVRGGCGCVLVDGIWCGAAQLCMHVIAGPSKAHTTFLQPQTAAPARPCILLCCPPFVQTNLTTAALGLGTIVLYAGVYTPLKQVSIVNTWVGAVVGAVPPLMGWAAAAGSLDVGAAILAAGLYFWQMPHFMALAWMWKADYAGACLRAAAGSGAAGRHVFCRLGARALPRQQQALGQQGSSVRIAPGPAPPNPHLMFCPSAAGGYRMLSLVDATGRRTAACALRNCLYLFPLGALATWVGVTSPYFAYESGAGSCGGCLGCLATCLAARPVPGQRLLAGQRHCCCRTCPCPAPASPLPSFIPSRLPPIPPPSPPACAAFITAGMMLTAAKFHATPTTTNARMLFRASLLHLPIFMTAFLLHRLPNTVEDKAGLLVHNARLLGLLGRPLDAEEGEGGEEEEAEEGAELLGRAASRLARVRLSLPPLPFLPVLPLELDLSCPSKASCQEGEAAAAGAGSSSSSDGAGQHEQAGGGEAGEAAAAAVAATQRQRQQRAAGGKL
jgi:heme O synthase-like polyprenyltransferase